MGVSLLIITIGVLFIRGWHYRELEDQGFHSKYEWNITDSPHLQKLLPLHLVIQENWKPFVGSESINLRSMNPTCISSLDHSWRLLEHLYSDALGFKETTSFLKTKKPIRNSHLSLLFLHFFFAPPPPKKKNEFQPQNYHPRSLTVGPWNIDRNPYRKGGSSSIPTIFQGRAMLKLRGWYSLFLHLFENGPFEDVFPIGKVGFPLLG